MFFNKFHFVLNKSLMVQQKWPIVTRWQITGMNNVDLSFREFGRQLGQNHAVISRLVQQYQQTNDVIDRNHQGLPRKTYPQ